MSLATVGRKVLFLLEFSGVEESQRSANPRTPIDSPSAGDDVAWRLRVSRPGERFPAQPPEQEAQKIQAMTVEFREEQQPIGNRTRRPFFDISIVVNVNHNRVGNMDRPVTPR
ncbi:MAG: hypothetical protein ABSG10_08405 [Terracidiphilus sp.]